MQYTLSSCWWTGEGGLTVGSDLEGGESQKKKGEKT